MAGSQTLRFDIVGDASSASRAFRRTADDAALAARGARQFSDSLAMQSRSARASADATLALAKSDSVLRDAQLTLAGATDDASGSLSTLRRRLDELKGKTAAARVSLDGDKEAQARLDAIDARLTGLDHLRSTPSLDIQGTARAVAELSAVDVALDKVGGKGGSAEGAASSLGLLASPMGAAVAAGVALSPVLVTVGAGLGGLAAAAYSTVSPILAAGTATKQQQEALGALDPAQRAAYDSLGALKTQFSGFAKSLEPEVLGVFNQGLKLAGGLLGDVEPVAAATGKALGVLVGDIGADLKTQQWQQFFGFMAQSAGPDIQLVGKLFTDLLNDLPQLLEEIQPVATGLLHIADDAALAFKAMDTLNPSLSTASVQAAQVQQNSGNMFTKLLASSKLVISDLTGIGKSTAGTAAAAKALGDSAAQSVTPQQQAASAAFGLLTNLTTLETRYGLTAAQAQALVKASGQTTLALSGTDAAATGALKAVEKYADANLAAESSTQQLAGDISVLGNNTLGATAQLNAFSDAWNLLIGNAVSDQQAVLTTSQAFQALAAEVKKNGSQSLTAQSDFLSYMSSIGQGLSTLQKNGASIGAVNAYYQVNIDRLKALHNLTPQQRADVEGLTRDYDVWAHSTAGLSRQVLTAAQSIKDRFTVDLKALGEFTPQVNTDVNNLANAVLKTGTTSTATRGDRQKLISDLEKTGIGADTARRLVDGLQRKINAMHGKTVPVTVTASGSGGVKVVAPGQSARSWDLEHLAAGGFVSGGKPGKDSVPAMLMPGEVVVPTAMVAGGAVDHLRGKLPGFAGGGLVDTPGWAAGQAAGTIGGWAGSDIQKILNSEISQYKASLGGPGAGTAVTRWAPDILRVLAMLRQSSSNLGPVEHRIGVESGGNPNAINLWDSNAAAGDPSRGLMQTIMATFQRYRSFALPDDIYNPLANIFAGVNYAVQAYPGRSLASVMLQAGGYDSGGYLPPGLSLAYNGTGRPEPVIPAGRLGSGPVHVPLHNGGVIGSQAELMRWLHNGIDDLARGSKLTYALQRSPSAAR